MLRVEDQFAEKSDQKKLKDTSLSTFLDHHLVLVTSDVVHSEQ